MNKCPVRSETGTSNLSSQGALASMAIIKLPSYVLVSTVHHDFLFTVNMFLLLGVYNVFLFQTFQSKSLAFIFCQINQGYTSKTSNA